MAVKPIPDGFRTLQPHLICGDAAAAMAFYAKAFGAEEILRVPGPGDSVMHGEMKIGDSMLMIAQEMPEMGTKSPSSLGGTGVFLSLYVEDCDAVAHRAIEAGCQEAMPMQDVFWGDRYGQVTDPFGHTWEISTHKEDLDAEQIAQRMSEMYGG